RQNRNDRDDDQQFDQGEAGAGHYLRLLAFHFPKLLSWRLLFSASASLLASVTSEPNAPSRYAGDIDGRSCKAFTLAPNWRVLFESVASCPQPATVRIIAKTSGRHFSLVLMAGCCLS